MAKKKKERKETTIENYYDLKVDKVDELVSILKDGEEEFTDEVSYRIADYAETEEDKKKAANKKFDPYKLDRMSRVPTWIKAFFVKIWSNGVVCFLFVWGMQNYIADHLDLMVLTGLMLGIINDLFVNTAFLHFQSDKREFDNYIMFPFPFKKFWTFFANIFYYIIVVFSVYFGIYYWVNKLFTFGLEPITFGLFTMLFDMAFIGIKDLIVHLVRKSKAKKQSEAEGISAEADAAFAVNPQKANDHADTVQDGQAAAEGAADKHGQETQNGQADDGQIDEVEKLRRLAESQNVAEKSGRKNTKKNRRSNPQP